MQEYVTVSSFKKLTQIPDTRLYRWLRDGTVKSYRTSKRGKYFIPLSEVVKYEPRLMRGQ